MSVDDERTSDPSAVLVEALVYAPIGLADAVVRSAPGRVRQFRSDLTAARFLGEIAVTRGLAELRSRRAESATSETVGPRTRRSAPPSERIGEAADTPTAATAPAVAVADTAPVPADDAAAPEPEPVPDVAELAIVDYDAVPSIDIVAQLEDLDADERARLGAYERAHRARRTVLGRLAQLEGTP